MTESTAPLEYTTRGGVSVARWTTHIDSQAIEDLVDLLDEHRGLLFTSTYEYPGRYTRWDMGFVDPPVSITARNRTVTIDSLNERGVVLLQAIAQCLQHQSNTAVADIEVGTDSVVVRVAAPAATFTEEERSRQPSVFSVLRQIIALFSSDDDAHLGVYGSFGYDLAFQFEPVTRHQNRNAEQRDMVLYIPDSLVIIDRMHEVSQRYDYDFTWNGHGTGNLERTGEVLPYLPDLNATAGSDHAPGEFAATVGEAIEYFKRGDLFEVTPSQSFTEPCPAPPSEVFRRLRNRNPSPYGALINLGANEYLVSASPEMYLRVDGRRIETCPIAGTIARGDDVLADADRIRELLNSEKDANELTMCTDVDRNDKSRVCDPSSVRIIGRRQIEMYSRLIHTVDHVEGTLLPQFDGLDAFLAHTWAVTVTGAPKLWAMRFIEEHEHSARAWYGAAIGALMFNGNINTGLTLRTAWIKDGVARVRAGATLLVDSDPEAEERETQTKASALLDAIRRPDSPLLDTAPEPPALVGSGLRVLLVDHEDSFVHTLAGYLRRTGAEVTTVRVPVGQKLDADTLQRVEPDFVVLSPGPGRPVDFNVSHTMDVALAAEKPLFGVCLGLQGIVEHFSGKLDVLDYPAHGRPSTVVVSGSQLFHGLEAGFEAGRYHSLIADVSTLPNTLAVTAQTDDGVVMAVEHTDLPVAAVQFHPESMMTLKGNSGMRLIENFILYYVKRS